MAEPLEKQMAIADVYAAALFALAREAGTVDTVRGELEELVQLVERDPALAAFLSSSAIDAAQRRDSLERVLRGRVSDVLLSTLQVLNAHGRVHLLQPLLRSFVARQEEAAGQIEAVVTTAVELTAAQRADTEAVVSAVSGKKPLVEFVVDPEILGGLVLQMGGYRFDHSVRRHLYAARQQMAERSARGLDFAAAQTA